jgi:hypothetical protein
MMRAWGNRDDCVVVDEPLYACYLAATGKPHPGAEEVIAAGETDWRKLACRLTDGDNEGKRVFYQKHMTHHLLPQMDRSWLGKLTNCFLIRHPREVLASYVKVVETPALEDLGFAKQAEIFEYVRENAGRIPPVLDAADVLKNPPRMLRLLCAAVGIRFQEAMLSWPPGPRTTDGVWAKHWYGEVEKSTSFRPYQPKQIDLPERLQTLCDQCEAYYDLLYQWRLK